jgi:FdhD protein
MIAPEDACVSIPYQRWRDGTTDSGSDEIVIEEPVEYQIDGKPVATVMRTPGHDRDLAIGFFFCEGWISAKSDVGALRLCESPTADGDATRTESSDANVVDLIPSADANLRPVETTRALPVTASCGVCGKLTIDEILSTVPPLDPEASRRNPEALISADTITELGKRLREMQPLFVRTGALHAAGIFDLKGEVVVVREDIGRHNAVDKAIGHCVRKLGIGRDRGLDGHALMVSGRVSFEVVQKALRARIPLIVAVSGVSSLAVDLAARGGVTLCGFSRERSFTAYTHPSRIIW